MIENLAKDTGGAAVVQIKLRKVKINKAYLLWLSAVKIALRFLVSVNLPTFAF
jgi:hypothetical protein